MNSNFFLSRLTGRRHGSCNAGWSRRLLAGAVALACLAPVAPSPGIAQNLPVLGDADREDLTPLAERKIGEQIMSEIRRDRDYLDDAPLIEYLNNMGNELLAARPDARGETAYDFFFFCVRDPVLNAFALPGGFIAVHSALVLAAQSESELASVMAHEIGHVAQRHIARMFGKSKQDALIPLASAVAGALAMHASPDAGMAMMMGGQGLAMQRQLNFSRDAEREADRIGLQILKAARYDTSGMIQFFGRMQRATRTYSEHPFAFLQSHPLTTERIADIQARTRDGRYKQRADSLDFYLIQARVRLLQDDTPQGWRDASKVYETLLQYKVPAQTVAGKYGLALVALRQADPAKAQTLLQDARRVAQGIAALTPTAGRNAILASIDIDVKTAAGQTADALKEADAARQQFPLSRGIARQYADALIATGRHDEAIVHLRDQLLLYRQEPQLQALLAKAYAAQGKDALQHIALAESYALAGSAQRALDQLIIARRAKDASFYEQSVIDARERELRAIRRDEIEEEKKNR